MNTLYMWDSDYPWDVRTEKICRSLARYGYEVHIAARNLKRRTLYENRDGIHIHRLTTWKSDRMNYALSFPLFFSPIWKTFIKRIVRFYEIDLIIVRDLPLAPLGIRTARKFAIPCIFDMAEDYVAMIRDIWNARKWQGLNLIVRNPYLAKAVEKYSFKNADHILVVVEESVDVVVRGGGSRGKVSIVSNTPSLESFIANDESSIAELSVIKDRFSAIYVGGIQMGRGIQTVLEAIPAIVRHIPDFLFVVVGDGYATEYFRRIIRKTHLEDYVLWVGWVEHNNIYDYIRASKIGIIPHLVSEHVSTTIPNKIFDYMGLGLPVISTDAAPMKRILDEEGCGVTYRSGDADDMARAMLDVSASNIDRGINGIEAVQSKYNWAVAESKLINVVERLVHEG